MVALSQKTLQRRAAMAQIRTRDFFAWIDDEMKRIATRSVAAVFHYFIYSYVDTDGRVSKEGTIQLD